MIKNKLKNNGITAFRLPGSMIYIPAELTDLNACVLNSLKSVFPHTRAIPGDDTIIHMASSGTEFTRINKNNTAKRLKNSLINTQLISPSYIEYKLDPARAKWFENSLRAATKRQNLDFAPVGVYFDLSYWNSMVSPRVKKISHLFSKITPVFFLNTFAVSGILLTGLLLASSRPLRISVPLCIAGTGFSSMLFGLIAIFSFQITYGYIFQWIGLLTCAFYAGTFLGSIWITRNSGAIKNDLSLFLKIDLLSALFAMALPFILRCCQYVCSGENTASYYKIVFVTICALSGMFTGAQFPLANKIALRQNTQTGKTAGILYSADMLGGWAGGLAGGVLLVPVLGIFYSCVVIAGLKLTTSACFAVSMKKIPK
jgi:spermidine synthase